MYRIFLIILVLGIFWGCSEESDNLDNLGNEGYSCYENFTCNSGLICNQNKICVKDETCKPDCNDKECGDDGCGGVCGSCEQGQYCSNFKCVETCMSKTCDELNAQCGNTDDGCGNIINCGNCPDELTCDTINNKCVENCIPKSCSELNAECGSIDDGCGGVLNCGSCLGDKQCSDNKCVENCIPKSCSELNAECGSIDDGCGGVLNCGSCLGELVCNSDTNTCVASCTPSCEYKECGSDGCGGSCGECGVNQACENFQCVVTCIPKTCDEVGAECGSIDDGCGLTLNCGSCGNNEVCSANHCVEQESSYQLIKDRHFRRGFSVRSADYPGDIIGSLIPGFETGSPIWTLGQWASFTNLNNFPETVTGDGYVYWEDSYKKVTIGDAYSVDLSFKVNAYNEYGGNYYEAGNSPGRTTWVHLLGEQQITDPYNQADGCPPLSELSALNFSIKARLLYDNRNISAGYDSSKHAAQYLIYFTIQNLNINSPGFGDYLWFGMTIHDDRGPRVVIQGDDFTQKLIYNIGFDVLNDYSNAPITDNQWHVLKEDLLPHILNALQEAWNRGYLADSHNLADYKIGGMNIGWEITGLNVAEMQIDDLSLIYERSGGNNNVNECALGTDNCDNNATCIDTDSGFICRCNAGYVGDGVTCTPGSVNEIRYDFNTNGNKEGWTTQNLNDLNPGGPNNGLWIMSVPGNDPMMISPDLNIDTSIYSKIEIRIANDHNPADTSVLQVFWSRTDSSGFSEAKSKLVGISNGGGWETYLIDLSSSSEWRGIVNKIRIDPILSGDGHAVGIDYIVIK